MLNAHRSGCNIEAYWPPELAGLSTFYVYQYEVREKFLGKGILYLVGIRSPHSGRIGAHCSAPLYEL